MKVQTFSFGHMYTLSCYSPRYFSASCMLLMDCWYICSAQKIQSHGVIICSKPPQLLSTHVALGSEISRGTVSRQLQSAQRHALKVWPATTHRGLQLGVFRHMGEGVLAPCQRCSRGDRCIGARFRRLVYRVCITLKRAGGLCGGSALTIMDTRHATRSTILGTPASSRRPLVPGVPRARNLDQFKSEQDRKPVFKP